MATSAGQRVEDGASRVAPASARARTPELRQMRYLVEVADAGQLTAAARRMGVAQPTLSQALVQLEEQLGVALLERRPRGVALTEVGERFVERCRRVLIAADEAAADARAMRRARSRQLVIGRDSLQPNGWSQLFFRLHRERPEIEVSWATLEFPRAGVSPLEHTDVALLTEPPAHPGVCELELGTQARVALLSARHRLAARDSVAVEEILDEVFVGCDPAMDPRWRAFWFLDSERGGPARLSRDRVRTVQEAIEAIGAGWAIGTSPEPLASALTHPGVVAVPLTGARPAAVKLVWNAETDNPSVELLVSLATELARDA
ncbi:LysR family transcriptional regulator [Thermoleophilia bacterium SCSIO 60948]|nr:LysR family transcriptional regulator [Thermoleophilia bacterium SCSIO 60948]